jgi:integrase
VPRFNTEAYVNRTLRVRELLDLVLRDYKVRELPSAATVVYPMRQVEAGLGDVRSSDLRLEILEDYLLARRAAGAAEATIKHELWVLHRGFVLAVERGIIDPHQVPRFPRIDPDLLRVRQGFVTEDQARGLLPRLDSDVADMVEFLFGSAWRVGEARKLVWPWVHQDAIRLPTSKNKKPRFLALAGEIRDIIERRMRRQNGPYVFQRRGQPIGDFRKQWRRACEDLGIEDRIVHDLRRSSILRLTRAQVDQKTQMSISGHSTTSTWRRYLIVDATSQAEALERVAYGGEVKAGAYRAGRPSPAPESQRRRWRG